ncbi:heterokaryon incompatibility protein-domain-containing protein [Clohesyomyces aquaticus]|uniref:Heterokaryon incompatibility protein-domain-containing protein n=1 Tax=Clohesyomyces aquaticus TaxID=1231657 RepID=A0A1Y1Z6E0_9PLEO|nr:heterokaryon incompatibility protein-domain-containing protein [Clohesyomyces aquaticus]
MLSSTVLLRCPRHRVFAQHPPVEVAVLLPTCQACSLRLLYHYHELHDGQIRLLQLLPGSHSSPIICSLTVVDIKHSPQYEALSYVWGDPSITEEIECDGRRLNVTVNLRDALRRFRYTDRVRLLWADAVCIDQANEAEKVKQVMMMGHIYWRAIQVTVWIGEDIEEDVKLGAHAAVRLMRSCIQEYEAIVSLYRDANKIPRIGSDAVPSGSDERWAWEALRRLLNRPYFKRVWVVQEVGLAREAIFYCGNLSFTRDELDEFANYLSNSGAILGQLFSIDSQQHWLMYQYGQATRGNLRIELGNDPKYAENFLDIMRLAKGLHCSDLRDAVYAFLGHPSAYKTKLLDVEPYICYPDNFFGRPTLIQANYTKTYGLKELYYDLAVAAVRTYDFGPKLFEYISHTEETIAEDYPSWIPRWNLSNEPTTFLLSPKVYYRASGRLTHTRFSIQPLSEPSSSETLPSQLHIQARFIDVICWVHPFPTESEFSVMPGANFGRERAPYDPDLNPLETLAGIFSYLRPELPNPHLHDDIDFATTIVAGLKRYEPGQRPVDENYEAHYADWCAYRIHKAVLAGPDFDEAVSKELDQKAGHEGREGRAERFALNAATACMERAFFCTEEGLIGLGPKCMKEGDECWIPRGARMPSVLRPVKGSGDHGCEDEPKMKVVGLAYIHGIMRGETVEGIGDQEWSEVAID